MYNDKYVKKYYEIIKENPEEYYEDFLKLKSKVKNSNAIYKGEPVPHIYQGLFYSQDDKNNFTNMCKILMNISRKVVKEYLTNREYRKLFKFPKNLENLILHDPGYDIPVPIARYDVFYNGGDIFKFCEFNTDGSSAMNEDNEIGKLLLETKAMKKFQNFYKIENVNLFTPWVKKSTKIYETIHNKKPNLAIVDFLDIGTTYEFEKFKKVYEDNGYNCIICDIRNLKYIDGKLMYEDYQIDLVYRRAVTVEFMKHYNELTDFISAYYDNAFMMLGSFRSQIMHTKLSFKILLDQATFNFLNSEEIKFLKAHIPYTNNLSPEHSKELKDNKDKYILKPVDDYGSHGVYPGRQFSQEDWNKKVDIACNNNYIYQEFYSMDPIKFVEFNKLGQAELNDFRAVLGMFIYDEEFIAPYTRIGKNPTIGGGKNYYTAPNIFVTNI